MNMTLIFSFLFFFLSGLMGSREFPRLEVSKQESESTINADLLTIFDLGIKRIYTDLLWIQTLLDSDLEHYKGMDGNSWMFHRFHTISLLDPWFIENYWYGGQYLSVIKDDDIGAKLLFEKGLESYPNDYHLLYYTGSHYLIELGDHQKALKYYLKIYDHPKTPHHIRALVTRLQAELGYLEESFQLLGGLYEKTPKDSPLKEAYRKKMYAVRAEIDLKCLNEKGKNCRKVDLFGQAYLLNNGVYQSREKWEKHRTYKKKKK